MISPEHVYTVLDVETTGLSPSHDRILEIGLVALDRNGAEIASYESLVNAGCDVGRTDVHGITDAMMRAAPSFAMIAPTVLEFIEQTVLVAHYAKFDMSFLHAEFDRAGLPLPELSSLCTIEAAKAVGLDGPYGMHHVAAGLGVIQTDGHHALPDARTCAGIFRRMLLRRRLDTRTLVRSRHARPVRHFPRTRTSAARPVSRSMLPAAARRAG